MGFSFNRISDFFVVVVIVVQEVLHERGFSELGASRAKKTYFQKFGAFITILANKSICSRIFNIHQNVIKLAMFKLYYFFKLTR